MDKLVGLWMNERGQMGSEVPGKKSSLHAVDGWVEAAGCGLQVDGWLIGWMEGWMGGRMAAWVSAGWLNNVSWHLNLLPYFRAGGVGWWGSMCLVQGPGLNPQPPPIFPMHRLL